MKLFLLILTLLTGDITLAGGISIKSGGYDVNINSSDLDQQSSTAVDSGVQMVGIAIINEKLFIDGERIPKNKLIHKSKISNKTYVIKWGQNDNITVKEK